VVVGKHKQINDEKLNLVRARVSHNEIKFEQKKYLYDSWYQSIVGFEIL
jgi:hypothetical protein